MYCIFLSQVVPGNNHQDNPGCATRSGAQTPSYRLCQTIRHFLVFLSSPSRMFIYRVSLSIRRRSLLYSMFIVPFTVLLVVLILMSGCPPTTDMITLPENSFA